MRPYGQEELEQGANWQSVLQMLRIAGAITGLVMMIVGLYFAIRVLSVLFNTLSDPESFQGYLDIWMTVLGREQLDIVIEGTTYHLGGILAVLVLGGGTFMGAWLSLGIAVAGGKTLAWTVGDQEAIKRILLHAFGPGKGVERPGSGDGGKG